MPDTDELTPPPDPASPADSARPEHPALAEFRARTRRSTRVYAVVLAVVVLAVFVFVKVAYARGELDHVSAATGTAPAPVAAASTAASVSLAWRSGDHPAGGDPYADGIVVTYDSHTVNGRDARTGAVRWHYTRSDQTICSVLQQDSSTIAIYRRDANCDEVTGFVTATGVTKWFRTLMDDGTTATASGPNVVLSVAANTVHVFDNAGGLDRWNWTAPTGCTVSRALGGSQGVLISLACAGGGHQLVLRGLIDDSVKWTISTATAVVPIAAGAVIAAVDPANGTVIRYSTDKGAASNTGRLTGSGVAAAAAALPRAATTVDASDANGQPVEYAALGQLFSLSANGVVRWTAAASGRPWLINTLQLSAVQGSDVLLVNSADGAVQRRVAIGADATGATAYPVGAGLLLAGTTTALYR